MHAVNYNGVDGLATLQLSAPQGFGQLKELRVTIEYPPVPQAPAVPAPVQNPSLCSRVVRGIFNHSGKLALVASGIILANHTEAGAKILADLSKEATQLATDHYEPVKNVLLQTANEAVQFGKDNLAGINAALSLIWAVPNAIRAGSKKMKAAWLLAGTASAAIPYTFKPGFTLEAALDSAQKIGASALALLKGKISKIEL